MTDGAAIDSTAVPPAPPLPHRRARVREVSSRFMSPLVQSNSTPIPSDSPRSKSLHRRQSSKTDENLIPEPNPSLDKSCAADVSTIQRKQHQQRVKRHINENGDRKDPKHSEVRVLSRTETPITMGTERVVPSRYRQVSSSIYRSNSLNTSSNGCSDVTAAARLLQEATSDVEKNLSRIKASSFDDSDSCSATVSNQGSSSCPNSPLCAPDKLRSLGSSMPDVDKWLAEKNSENSSKAMGDCMRSLNFSSSVKMGGGVSRPPHPSVSIRSGLDARKGRKLSNHQEDVHSLKMSSNCYLQWRFANAKAEASIHAQKQEAGINFCAIGGKITDIHDQVKKKRSELAVLRGIQTLTTIVEAEMPYLEEWSTLEEDYSNSLSGMTNALLRSSIRLPVSGEVQVDAGELREALNSALKVVKLIVGTHIQRFIQKAEEMDILISELARMVRGEKALIEECGDLLSKTYSWQVNECSLRGTIMQLHYCNHHQSQKIKATK